MIYNSFRSTLTATSKDIELHLAQILSPLWRKGLPRRRLGLAISGGVDSMALATLCRSLDAPKDTFTGFIVDHGLRAHSSEEARAVADELKCLGIRPFVLTLDWKAHGHPSGLKNFETVARKLRYQELGRACYDQGIGNLLVAHHADDHVETVLVRILTGYLGTGLKAIQSRAKIPYCEGIYGADASGEPVVRADRVSVTGENTKRAGMAVEDGGVTIVRPLLPFAKDQLVSLCREAGTKWYEDQSNSDVSLTLRNSIRGLQTQQALPNAFKRMPLCALADSQAMKKTQMERHAQAILEGLPIILDLRYGAMTVSVKELLWDVVTKKEEDYHLKAVLLRKLLDLVSPSIDISLHDLDLAVDLMFGDSARESPEQVTVANVVVRRAVLREAGASVGQFCFYRQPPVNQELKTLDLGNPEIHDIANEMRWTGWSLWDNRYWIRMGHPRNEVPVQDVRHFIRFLTKDSLAHLRKSYDDKGDHFLERLLQGAPSKMRFTLPAIFQIEHKKEEIVALPTLRWWHPKWGYHEWEELRDKRSWVWEIRYKHIEFEETDLHKLLS